MEETMTIEMSITNQQQAIFFYNKAMEHLNSQGFVTVPGLRREGNGFYPTMDIVEMTKTEYEQYLAQLAEKKEAKAKAETGVKAEKVNSEVEVKEVKAK